MKIRNQSKDTFLADNAFLASTVLARAKGLLGKKDFGSADGLILSPCNCVHTFFMRFPIDVLFADKNKRVIKSIPSLLPFSLSPLCLQAKFVIELPAGAISASRTTPGDALSF